MMLIRIPTKHSANAGEVTYGFYEKYGRMVVQNTDVSLAVYMIRSYIESLPRSLALYCCSDWSSLSAANMSSIDFSAGGLVPTNNI